MTNKKNIILKSLVLLLIPISMWFAGHDWTESIKKDCCYSVARITGIWRGVKGNYDYQIRFIDKKNDTIIVGSHLCFGPNNNIINKYFLVAYMCNKPTHFEVLIRKEDYDRYNLIYPDSLKWVDKYLE